MQSSTTAPSDFLQLSRHAKAYIVLNLLVVVGLCATTITASKIVTIGPISFACCNIIFALLTFPVTDTISEIFGIKYAKITVLIGCVAQILFMVLIQSSLYVPASPLWENETAYNTVLSIGPRVVIANLVAFLIASFWDVTVYAKLKKWNRGKFLWIRNNLSTSSAQILNAFLFMNITFYGTGLPVGKLVLGSLVLRFFLAAIDTPLVYLAVNSINKYLNGETIAYTSDE